MAVGAVNQLANVTWTKIRTEFHVREKSERATLRSALDEAHTVNPKLHVLGRGPSVLVEKERHQNTGI